ncbi:MAG: TIGR01548 family HAD-type hydrolase, partial [Cyanobacteriota bacterium]|nr:TIGR01548 family HAD-type hydrolase [Cyanobacteriota bacterium]
MIRDVAASYRRAIQETVHHYSGWRPSVAEIDALKTEGIWNNDWDASLELLRRDQKSRNQALELPSREQLIEVFSRFYFGGDPNGDPSNWQGFIRNEPLLVNQKFFEELSSLGFAWGFVSGAEPPSARFVLEQRLGLKHPALIAMGEAPDKPDPTGLLQL